MNELITKWSKKNLDVYRTLLSLTIGDKEQSDIIINKLKESSIRGEFILRLFKDLCDNDYDKVEYLCLNVPKDVLEAACESSLDIANLLIEPYLELTWLVEKYGLITLSNYNIESKAFARVRDYYIKL